MKHIIMVNPISGKKKGYKHAQIIQRLLKKYNIDSEIITSEYAGQLREIAYEISHKYDTRFYSVGGDGTLNEIVSGIIGTNSDIVVLPCGTGNDFSKHVNKYFSLRKIINLSINKKSSKFDVIKLNDNRYCINILNAGFDALVAYNIKYFRWIPFISGKAVYNLSIIFTLFNNRNYKIRIRTNNFAEKSKYTLIAISNGKYYGGGVVPSSKACADDGKLSICKIYSTSILKKIRFLPQYKRGEHEDLEPVYINDDITYVSLVSNHKFPLSIDGEVTFTKRIRGKILKNAVNIVKIEDKK